MKSTVTSLTRKLVPLIPLFALAACEIYTDPYTGETSIDFDPPDVVIVEPSPAPTPIPRRVDYELLQLFSGVWNQDRAETDTPSSLYLSVFGANNTLTFSHRVIWGRGIDSVYCSYQVSGKVVSTESFSFGRSLGLRLATARTSSSDRRLPRLCEPRQFGANLAFAHGY